MLAAEHRNVLAFLPPMVLGLGRLMREMNLMSDETFGVRNAINMRYSLLVNFPEQAWLSWDGEFVRRDKKKIHFVTWRTYWRTNFSSSMDVPIEQVKILASYLMRQNWIWNLTNHHAWSRCSSWHVICFLRSMIRSMLRLLKIYR